MKIAIDNCRKCIHSSVCTWYGAEYCDWYVNTCDDAISRQAVLDAMYDLCDTGETLKENPWRDNPHIDAITDVIEDLPSVTPQQRTGQWVKQKYGWNWQCSECGFVTPPSAKEILHFVRNVVQKWRCRNETNIYNMRPG